MLYFTISLEPFLKLCYYLTMIQQNKEKLISQLRKALAKQPIKLAYLYGSYARGQETPKSDIDIAVVMTEKTKTADYEIAAALQKIIGKSLPEIEVREIKSTTEPVFLRSVLKDKITLLARSEKERVDFETKGMKKFYDTQHLRNLNFYYLKKSLKEGNYGSRPTNFTKLA